MASGTIEVKLEMSKFSRETLEALTEEIKALRRQLERLDSYEGERIAHAVDDLLRKISKLPGLFQTETTISE